MELKKYQTEVINDLDRYMQLAFTQGARLDTSYREYWAEKGVTLKEGDDILHPYNNAIKGIPRVTAKVPTAGGKTFIACNALKTIFEHLPEDKAKVVVWFVPSDTILEQTYQNLSNSQHPYRQKLDTLFNGSVKVLNKREAMQAHGISPTDIKDQLTIFVFSVDSFVESTRNPLAYRENEHLTYTEKIPVSPDKQVPNANANSLIMYLTRLNPVVIVDESHNFTSDLRVDLLSHINPCFIYELTATPKKTSNVISIVDAMKLKKENMVKLPVIVNNYKSTDDVIERSIQMRDTLEEVAKKEEAETGYYVRPIVLFQAQPNISEESYDFNSVKESIVKLGIPEEQVRIKTANNNEIAKDDLMSRDCPVRYIITVNALKEGWDCPFAYILASLANKTSRIDVEQIIGRILRQPYTHNFTSQFLNYSYVFTSSSQFNRTLESIVHSLNDAGFSGRDYVKDKDFSTEEQKEHKKIEKDAPNLFEDGQQEEPQNAQEETLEIDTETIKENLNSNSKSIDEILASAAEAGNQYDDSIKAEESDDIDVSLSNEAKDKMKDNIFAMQKMHIDDASKIALPKFCYKAKQTGVFGSEDEEQEVDEEYLMKGFDLEKADKNIDLQLTSSNSQMIELEERSDNEWVPRVAETPAMIKNVFFEIFSTLKTKEGKVNQLSDKIAKSLSITFNYIADPMMAKYIKSIIKDMREDRIDELAMNISDTTNAFKAKIKSLALKHRKDIFNEQIKTGQIYESYKYQLPKEIVLGEKKCVGMSKMLYQEEDHLDTLEDRFAKQLIALDNVDFWHKNQERGHGFFINGFINHYPDFIIRLKSGKVVLVETKGNQLNNTDSKNKLELGDLWQSYDSTRNFSYFMTYDNNGPEGSYSMNKLIGMIGNM